MAADFYEFLLQGATSLVAGLLGVSLGAWLTGLYKIKGEIVGRSEKIDAILTEVQATAKATELSKIAARADGINAIINEVAQSTRATESTKIATRLEKLDQILPEVRAVTETQKRIETTVAAGEWDRQWRLNQMRDAYGRLLVAIYGLQDYFYVAPEDDEQTAESREAFALYRKNGAEFKNASALTRILAGPGATLALDKYDKRIQARYGMPPRSQHRQALHDLAELHSEVLEAARHDLGVYS